MGRPYLKASLTLKSRKEQPDVPQFVAASRVRSIQDAVRLSAHDIPETSINIKQQTIARETRRKPKITRPSSDHSPAFPTLRHLRMCMKVRIKS